MAINSDGKVAYIYKDGTWYAISGAINTNASYTWTAAQTFSSPVTFEEVLISRAGINNFQSPETRDIAIPNPVDGAVCFIRQATTGGTVINQLQYYSNGWKNISGYSNVVSKLGSYSIDLDDAGKVITVDSSSASVIALPTNAELPIVNGFKFDVIRLGTGTVQIDSSATILSKNPSGAFIDSRYGRVTVIKIDTNTWVVSGDVYEGVSSPSPAPAPVSTPTPTPVAPTPVAPTPIAPAPVAPAPVTPAPTSPVAPTPVAPSPAVPTPTPTPAPAPAPAPTQVLYCGNETVEVSTLECLSGQATYNVCYYDEAKTQVATATFIECITPSPTPTPTPTPAPILLDGYYALFCSGGQVYCEGGTQYASAGELEAFINANYENASNFTYQVGSCPDVPKNCGGSPTPTPAPTPAPAPSSCNPDDAWSYTKSMCQACGYYYSDIFGECSTTPWDSPAPSPAPAAPTPAPAPATPVAATAWYCKTETLGGGCSLSGPFASDQSGSGTGYVTICDQATSNPYTCPSSPTPSPAPSPAPAPAPAAPVTPIASGCNPDDAWSYTKSMCQACGYYYSDTFGECSTTPWPSPTPAAPAPAAPVAPTPAAPSPAPSPAAPSPAPAPAPAAPSPAPAAPSPAPAPAPAAPSPAPAAVSTARSSFCSGGQCYTYVGGANCTQNQSFVTANYEGVTGYNCVVGTTTPACPSCSSPTPSPVAPSPAAPSPAAPVAPSPAAPVAPSPAAPTPVAPTPAAANQCDACPQYVATSGACANCTNCVNGGGFWTGSSCVY